MFSKSEKYAALSTLEVVAYGVTLASTPVLAYLCLMTAAVFGVLAIVSEFKENK
jgi:hypothetical protein